jgi:hypothetical protein
MKLSAVAPLPQEATPEQILKFFIDTAYDQSFLKPTQNSYKVWFKWVDAGNDIFQLPNVIPPYLDSIGQTVGMAYSNAGLTPVTADIQRWTDYVDANGYSSLKHTLEMFVQDQQALIIQDRINQYVGGYYGMANLPVTAGDINKWTAYANANGVEALVPALKEFTAGVMQAQAEAKQKIEVQKQIEIERVKEQERIEAEKRIVQEKIVNEEARKNETRVARFNQEKTSLIQVYNHYLKRNPTQDEQDYWLSRIMTDTATIADVEDYLRNLPPENKGKTAITWVAIATAVALFLS